MAVEVIIGPYRSGKTGRLLEELVANKKEQRLDHCLILVPSHRYGRLLRTQLFDCVRKANGISSQAVPVSSSTRQEPDDAEHYDDSTHRSIGLFGVQIATIYEACQQVLRAAGVVPTVLPKEICANVLAQCLEQLNNRNELTHLKAICGFAGTSASLLQLFDEMERAAFTPAEVIAKVDDTAASSSRHFELARVYKEYWTQLDKLGCLDQKRLALACRETLTKKVIPGFHLRWLLIDGFDRISPLQAEVMSGLSQHASETRIAFDHLLPQQRGVGTASYDESQDDYLWKESSFSEITNRFPVTPTFLASPGNVAAAEQEAFSTLDRIMEMEEIARRCKEALVVRKVPAGQILVVARDINRYAGAARAAFDNAAIPYFIDEGVAYNTIPAMKVLQKSLGLSIDDFPRAAVIECLRSRYLDLTRLGITAAQVESLDKKSLEAGVVGGRKQWQDFLQRLATPQVAAKVGEFFDRVTPPPAQHISAFCHWVEELEANIFTLSRNKEELEALQGLREAVRTVMLQEQLFPHTKLTFEQFVVTFTRVIEQSTFRRQQPADDLIYICAAEQAPNRRFDEMYIAGVTEGDFPKHSGESGFVSADERGRWTSFGIDIRNPREHAGFERALFTSLIQRGRKRICFSHPEVDLAADELIPSFYLSDRTAQIEKVESIQHASAGLRKPISAKNAVAGWLWLKPGTELPESFEHQPLVQDYWSKVSIPLFGACRRHETQAATAYNGYLTDLLDSGWLSIKLPTTWSATALNRYGQCPFKFWMAQMLKVEPLQEPEAGLTIQFKGKLYHKALELYYSALYGGGEQVVLSEDVSEPPFLPGSAGGLPASTEACSPGRRDACAPGADQHIDPAGSAKSTAAHHSGEGMTGVSHRVDPGSGLQSTEFTPAPDVSSVQADLLKAALDQAIESAKGDPEFRPGPFWENEQKEILFRLSRFVTYDEQRLLKDKNHSRPTMFEAKFGFTFDRSSFPALVVETEFGPATIRGVIDRIDLSQLEGTAKTATVIDYKTGSTAIPLDDARKGANIQLPLYALALQRSILPGYELSAGHYLSINSAKSNGSMDFQSDKMSDILDSAEQHVRNAVKNVRRGDFSVRPYSSKACKNCDYITACRITDLKVIAEDDD